MVVPPNSTVAADEFKANALLSFAPRRLSLLEAARRIPSCNEKFPSSLVLPSARSIREREAFSVLIEFLKQTENTANNAIPAIK